MSTPRSEWKTASAFAEVAEALGVTTRDVCAMWSPDNGRIDVLYTREGDSSGYIIHARLGREPSGILSRLEADTATNLTVESMMKGRDNV